MTYMWHFPVFDIEDPSSVLRCNSETPPERSTAYPIPSPEAIYLARVKTVATVEPSVLGLDKAVL